MRCLFYCLRYAAAVAAAAGGAAAQVAILQIQVVAGEGTVYAAGTRTSHAVTVAVSDETGKPVAGAAVSFHLPEDGPGGTFVNGLRTDVVITDAQGRASVRGFQANRLPGRFQVRIVASKEQARAGTVSFQYIGERSAGAAPVHSNRKWLAIAAAAAGGVLAGALISRGGTDTPLAVASPVTTPPISVLTVGTPTISVGKP